MSSAELFPSMQSENTVFFILDLSILQVILADKHYFSIW